MNTFSVTLFSSGDILFDYEEVNVLADPDDSFPVEGLHSVVGVTAGNQSSGTSVDLSAVTPLDMTTQSIYQVFPGDRIYVKADALITFDTWVTKIVNPINRMFGVTLLGAETIFSIKNRGLTGTGTP